MADTLETLEIQVKHNASGADTEIGKVTAQIAEMGNVLTTVLPQLREYANLFAKVGSSIRKNLPKAKGEDALPLSQGVQDSIKGAGKLEIALHKVQEAGRKMFDAFKAGDVDAAVRAREQQLNAQAKVDKLRTPAAPPPTPVPDNMRDLISNASQIDLLKMKLEDLRAAMQRAFDAGDASKAQQLRGQILQTTAALERAQKAAEGASDGIKKLSLSAAFAQTPLGNFINSLKRIAFYRIIRSIIKAITKSFSEGANAAVQFAKTTGGHLQYLADAYDNLANHGTMMSGQLGASLATLVSAIAPLLIRLINLITAVADALTQLFAAFGGQGFYAKATKGVKGWGEAAGGAAKAAKEWKNQLMGFDEINRLEAPNDGGGGGGGGGGLGDFQFEEAELSKWAKWIKDHLELVKSLVAAIGIGLAAWKIGKFVASLGEANGVLGKVFGIAMSVAGAFLLIKGTCEAWVEGVNFDNLTEMILGTALAAGGLALAFGAVGAGIALIVGGAALLVVSIRDWIKTGKLGTNAFWGMEAGIAAVGIGLSLLTGSWIPLLIAAVLGLALAIYKYWDEIKEYTHKIWETIKATVKFFLEETKRNAEELMEKIKQKISEKLSNIQDKFSEVWGNIVQKAKDKFEEMKEKITTKLDSVREAIREKLNRIKELFNMDMGPPHIRMPHLSVTGTFSLRPPSVPHFHVEYYAKGGFPDAGDLFVANEQGAEMVGAMGNRTTVANNQQIVAGISQGVEEANEGVITAIYAIADRLIDAIEDSGGTLNFDEFVRGVTRTQQRQARAQG